MKRQLSPPRDVRHVVPHVCAFCNEFRYDPAGYWECLRANGTAGDTSDGRQYETTCNRWRAAKHDHDTEAA